MTALEFRDAAERRLAARRDEYKRRADQAHEVQSYEMENQYRLCSNMVSEAILVVIGTPIPRAVQP